MKQKIGKLYLIFIAVYTLFVLYLMFFGFGRTPYDFNIVRLRPLLSTFDFVRQSIGYKSIIINICGNILMFIPYGFLGLIFPKLNEIKGLIINFLFAIIIVESLQYFTRLGVFDIDDLLLNTVGVVIGFYFYKWFFKTFIDKDS